MNIWWSKFEYFWVICSSLITWCVSMWQVGGDVEQCLNNHVCKMNTRTLKMKVWKQLLNLKQPKALKFPQSNSDITCNYFQRHKFLVMSPYSHKIPLSLNDKQSPSSIKNIFFLLIYLMTAMRACSKNISSTLSVLLSLLLLLFLL